jgi:hypothetical protein
MCVAELWATRDQDFCSDCRDVPGAANFFMVEAWGDLSPRRSAVRLLRNMRTMRQSMLVSSDVLRHRSQEEDRVHLLFDPLPAP